MIVPSPIENIGGPKSSLGVEFRPRIGLGWPYLTAPEPTTLPAHRGCLREIPADYISRDEIVLWWMETDQIALEVLPLWLETLDEAERQRSAKFFFDEARREFIAAHTLLRSMLATYLDPPPQPWRFLRDLNGKPRIDSAIGSCEVAFSLSHARGLVAVAMASQGQVGVDVEKIEPAKADFTVAETYFAPAEVQMLRQAAPCDRTMCFFCLWTLKEAYTKALGAGLEMPLNSFAFTFDRIGIDLTEGGGSHPANWQFATLPVTRQHILSLAVNYSAAAPVRVRWRVISQQSLQDLIEHRGLNRAAL
jgi:4'-phosphopantetheinyl transferase